MIKNLIMYYCATSYASHKVMIFMAAKCIACQMQHVNLRKQEHILGDYRQINPLAQVPALQDLSHDKIICGSTDIMFYLNDYYVDAASQLPPALRQPVKDFCLAHEQLHDPYIRTLSYHLLFMNRSLTEQKRTSLLEAAAKHPNQQRGEFLQQAIQGALPQALIEEAYQKIAEALQQIALLLQGGKQYLFGEAFTMADAVAIAGLYRFQQMDIPIQSSIIKNYYKQFVDEGLLVQAGVQ